MATTLPEQVQEALTSRFCDHGAMRCYIRESVAMLADDRTTEALEQAISALSYAGDGNGDEQAICLAHIARIVALDAARLKEAELIKVLAQKLSTHVLALVRIELAEAQIMLTRDKPDEFIIALDDIVDAIGHAQLTQMQHPVEGENAEYDAAFMLALELLNRRGNFPGRDEYLIEAAKTLERLEWAAEQHKDEVTLGV